MAIVRHPARTWSKDTMGEVITVYVITHNMIVEDENDDSLYKEAWQFLVTWFSPKVEWHHFNSFLTFIMTCMIKRTPK